MTIRQTLDIIGGSIIAALITAVIVLACIVSRQSKTIAIIKNDRNYLSQTIDKLKAESVKQQEILDERNGLLIEVKKSRTLQEYLVVWRKINDSIK